MKNVRYSSTVYQSYNTIIIFCVKKTQKKIWSGLKKCVPLQCKIYTRGLSKTCTATNIQDQHLRPMQWF